MVYFPTTMIEADIYKALGDPVRLTMVKRLAKSSPQSIGKLSQKLGVSRQGARKQLQVLVTAELVELRPKGRTTEVELNTKQLKTAREFIRQLELQWDQRLNALKAYVENQDRVS